MKRKFTLMGRVAIALVLALSLTLVMAVPAVSANGPNYNTGVELGQMGNASALWSTSQAHSGKYSAHLNSVTTPHSGDEARVEIPLPAGTTLGDIMSISWSVYAVAGYPPHVDITLDTPLDSDQSMLTAEMAYNNAQGKELDSTPSLTTYIAYNTGWVQTFELASGDGYGQINDDTMLWVTKMGAGNDDAPWGTLADWKAGTVASDPGNDLPEGTEIDADTLVLKLEIEVDSWVLQSEAYVDDVEINGVTYDLEPPLFMDASYYQIGDTVTVTVLDEGANSNVAIQETVIVDATSDTPENSIMLALLETGVDTGVFTATFTLVNATPGAGELLVSQLGALITVTYDLAEDTAVVDSVAPVVEITAPEDGDFVAGEVSITAEVTEINPDTAVLTIGGEVIEAGDVTYVEGTVSYTWNTAELDVLEAVWPDGPYTIEVVATDLAGNVGSDSIDVTVDNTEPVIGDQKATPPVVKPAIENTIVFTATVTDDNIDTVTIDLGSIGGSATEPMLDGGVAPDEMIDDGIYTADITTTIATEATYSLTVTATDLAGLSATADITLVVSSDTVPPVITDAAITYPFVGVDSAQPSEDVIISVNVTDDIGMGTVTAECDVITSGAMIDLVGDDGIYTATVAVDDPAGWGDYPITITATDAKGNEAIDETLILAVRTGATGVEIALVEGWNLISLPLIPVSPDITVVISATTLLSEDVSSVGTVVGYDPATGDFPRYIPGTGGALTEMEDGVGYWVFMEEADTLVITGREWPVPPEVPPVYSVVEGWNLIGVKSIVDIAYNLYLGNLYEDDLPEFSVIWGYNAVAGRYFSVYPMPAVPEAEDLVPGHGYWLWMKTEGTIVPPQ